MASDSAVVYFRASIAGPSQAKAAVVYFPFRSVSGLYGTGLTTQATKKNWKPSALTPLVDANGHITPEWNRFIGLELANKRLGGANFLTLPQVANFVTQQQVDNQIAAAQDQWMASLAQTMQAILEVVKAASLAGVDQVPPVVLARQETNPQPVGPITSGDTGGGGGGD